MTCVWDLKSIGPTGSAILLPLLIGKYGFMWIFPMCACLENVETSTGNCFMDALILKWGLSDGICKMCSSHEENVEHLLYTCSKLSGIWEDIVQFINNVFETRITLNRFSVLAGILINDETNAVVNVVISIARFEIWKRRNVFRYENIFIDPLIIVAKIKFEVKWHFQILAKKTCSKYVPRCIEQI